MDSALQLPAETLPLVLHRVVKGDITTAWEDITEAMLERMVGHIGSAWATFRHIGPVTQRPWMLTFDDGYASDYEIVLPVLLRAGMSGTFFLITDNIGKPGYLTWDQVREMYHQGMCIGSHSASHCQLTHIGEAAAKEELARSRQVLENQLGGEVSAFSFPYGAYTSTLCGLALEAGYRFVCTSDHGSAKDGQRIIPRNAIHSKMNWRDVERLMQFGPLVRTQLYALDTTKKLLKGMLGGSAYLGLRKWIFHGV